MLLNLFAPIARLLFPRLYILPAHLHARNYEQSIPGNLGGRTKRTVVYADYTVTGSDQYVVGIATCNITLPAASSVPEGFVVVIANANPASYTVSVILTGADTAAGHVGVVALSTTNAMATFVSDGTDNWETRLPAV